MINERSPFIRRSPQQHYHHDRLYSNPNRNPNPKLFLKEHGSVDWTGEGEPSPPMSAQPQFAAHQQKEWGLLLTSSTTGSSLSHSAPCSSTSPLSVAAASGEGGGNRFKARAAELPSPVAASASAAMRDTYNRTKVVIRHLPPGLSESAFMEEITSRFSSMYNMVWFCPGKSSVKSSSFSRAYIDFKHPEDVIDFFESFNGHVFVNERGTQFKAVVEYAPNQRVPKVWARKDPREGSIFQDPDYIKFTEQISKPIEYLPSAEAQLERKEIERISISGVKEAIIVTPLMEFVRQKRALKSMPQKSVTAAGKINVRGGASMTKMVLKRGADRSRTNSMYTTASRVKEKATYVPRYDDAQRRELLADKKGRVVLEAKDNKIIQEDSVGKAATNNQGASALKSSVEQGSGKGFGVGKKNSMGLDKEELINGIPSGNSGASTDGKSAAPVGRVRTTASKSPASFTNIQNTSTEDSCVTKPSQRIESGGRLNSKGASSSKTPFLLQKAEQQNDRDKRFSRVQVWKTSNRELNASESESVSTQLLSEDKNDAVRQDGRRLRNKDRPDRPVWTVRQRADATELPKNSTATPSISPPGSQRQGRGPRDSDSNALADTSKPPSKRAGSATVYGGHEKQVWVAKPGSGS